jgi:hypothetical protein
MVSSNKIIIKLFTQAAMEILYRLNRIVFNMIAFLVTCSQASVLSFVETICPLRIPFLSLLSLFLTLLTLSIACSFDLVDYTAIPKNPIVLECFSTRSVSIACGDVLLACSAVCLVGNLDAHFDGV